MGEWSIAKPQAAEFGFPLRKSIAMGRTNSASKTDREPSNPVRTDSGMNLLAKSGSVRHTNASGRF